VIDTFKKVFVATYSSKDSIGPAKAEAIVSNAIKRVLEPDMMTNVPAEPDEEGVARAFESILVQSQGPPRQATPSQPAPVPQAPPIATSTVANAAVTAATTAGAPTVSGPKSNAPPTVSRPPQPQPPLTNTIQPHSRSHTPVAPPTAPAAPPQSQTKSQRPAEANLMSLLMGTPATESPSAANVTAPVTAPKTSPPATVPPTTSASASKASIPATAPVPTANMGQLPQKLNGIAAIRVNGTSTPTRPAVEPLTPPPGAVNPVAPSILQAGTKRGRSPQVEVLDAKKAKVEGGD
jgi:hypothetical protein